MREKWLWGIIALFASVCISAETIDLSSLDDLAEITTEAPLDIDSLNELASITVAADTNDVDIDSFNDLVETADPEVPNIDLLNDLATESGRVSRSTLHAVYCIQYTVYFTALLKPIFFNAKYGI